MAVPVDLYERGTEDYGLGHFGAFSLGNILLWTEKEAPFLCPLLIYWNRKVLIFTTDSIKKADKNMLQILMFFLRHSLISEKFYILTISHCGKQAKEKIWNGKSTKVEMLN